MTQKTIATSALKTPDAIEAGTYRLMVEKIYENPGKNADASGEIHPYVTIQFLVPGTDTRIWNNYSLASQGRGLALLAQVMGVCLSIEDDDEIAQAFSEIDWDDAMDTAPLTGQMVIAEVTTRVYDGTKRNGVRSVSNF